MVQECALQSVLFHNMLSSHHSLFLLLRCWSGIQAACKELGRKLSIGIFIAQRPRTTVGFAIGVNLQTDQDSTTMPNNIICFLDTTKFYYPRHSSRWSSGIVTWRRLTILQRWHQIMSVELDKSSYGTFRYQRVGRRPRKSSSMAGEWQTSKIHMSQCRASSASRIKAIQRNRRLFQEVDEEGSCICIL